MGANENDLALPVYTKNSMNYWYPKIKDLGIPMPETRILLPKHVSNWYRCLDGIPLPSEDVDVILANAEELGYPVFMRSDLVSVKHEYLNTCFVGRKEELVPHLVRIIEGNALRDQPMTTIVLRKYLSLVYGFKAFRGLPIAPERRYFVIDGEVVCHHPYWPEEAIHGKRGTYRGPASPPKNWEMHTKYLGLPQYWRRILKKMNTETPEEIELLSGYASKIGKVLGGAWSVDFALAYTARNHKAKQWYMIDAALAAQSYHDPKCPMLNRCKGKRSD